MTQEQPMSEKPNPPATPAKKTATPDPQRTCGAAVEIKARDGTLLVAGKLAPKLSARDLDKALHRPGVQIEVK